MPPFATTAVPVELAPKPPILFRAFKSDHPTIPFPGRAETIALRLDQARRALGDNPHVERLSELLIGERTPELAPLHAMFEHFCNELAAVQGGAGLAELSARIEALEATISRLKPSALAAEPG